MRLGGETGLVKRIEQEVARGIPGEHSAGSVCAMGSRGQPHQQEPCLRVPEGWHRPPPVVPIPVSAALPCGHLCSVLDEAAALLAIDDFPLQGRKRSDFVVVGHDPSQSSSRPGLARGDSSASGRGRNWPLDHDDFAAPPGSAPDWNAPALA